MAEGSVRLLRKPSQSSIGPISLTHPRRAFAILAGMPQGAKNSKKTRREWILVVLTALLVVVGVGTLWETYEKDRPQLKITSARASRQDDQFMNLLLVIENEGESSATLKQIFSRPLTGSVANPSENQECYNELGNAKEFPNPRGEDRDKLLKKRTRPVVVLVELPPHCVGRINFLAVEIDLTYAGPFGNVYHQSEYISSAVKQ
jgi:hypothetical protein